MQLSWISGALSQVGCAVLMALSVSACNNGNAAGDAARGNGAVATAEGAKTASYVLRTRMRPESPDKYFDKERGAYELCAGAARGLNLPVKPFPAIPADFVAESHTYASDGKRFSHRQVDYHLDPGRMTPEQGCEVRLASQWNVSVISDGREQSASQDEHGEVHVTEAEPVVAEPVRAAAIASRPLAKRINDVPVKCDEQGDCIVDPGVVLVAQGRRPVSVANRNDNVGVHGTALIVEPVSLAVGQRVDPGLFALEQGK